MRPKTSPLGFGEHRTVKNLDQLGQQVGLKPDVVFRQSACQQFVAMLIGDFIFNRDHRIANIDTQSRTSRKLAK